MSVKVTMYHAEWCGNCTRMMPLFEAASKIAPSRFETVSDVQMHQGEAPSDINITGFPTFVFRRDGRIVHVIVGADARDFKAQVRKFFGADISDGVHHASRSKGHRVDHNAFRSIFGPESRD